MRSKMKNNLKQREPFEVIDTSSTPPHSNLLSERFLLSMITSIDSTENYKTGLVAGDIGNQFSTLWCTYHITYTVSAFGSY